jgi:hypothetical protein
MKTKHKQVLAVRKGSVLLTERPFVYMLKSKLRGERCDNCFRRWVGHSHDFGIHIYHRGIFIIKWNQTLELVAIKADYLM